MTQQQQHEPPMSNLIYRVEQIERDLVSLKSQFSLYEPTRENDLKLQRINDTVGRIESELSKVKERLETMNTHMVAQEAEAQKREAEQRDSQNKLVIRALWVVVSAIITVLTLVLAGYVTHFFH